MGHGKFSAAAASQPQPANTGLRPSRPGTPCAIPSYQAYQICLRLHINALSPPSLRDTLPGEPLAARTSASWRLQPLTLSKTRLDSQLPQHCRACGVKHVGFRIAQNQDGPRSYSYSRSPRISSKRVMSLPRDFRIKLYNPIQTSISLFPSYIFSTSQSLYLLTASIQIVQPLQSFQHGRNRKWNFRGNRPGRHCTWHR